MTRSATGQSATALSPLIRYSAVGLYIIANLPFLIRYCYRVDSLGGIATITATIAYIALIITTSVKFSGKNLSSRFLLLSLGGFTIVSVGIMQFIPIESFNVDRYEIISLFWDSVRNGLYPYAQYSSIGNQIGASPFYFIMAYPSYASGLYELMPLSVPWIWWFCFPGLSKDCRISGLLFLFLSPLFYYEILTRSTLLFNSIFIAAYCHYLLYRRQWPERSVIICGIAGGLLLNTRTVFGLPMAVTFFYMIRQKGMKWKMISMAMILIATYISFFLIAAAFWSPEEVIAQNPFTVQSDNLYPTGFMLTMGLLSIFGGLIADKKYNLLISAILLFISIVAYAIIHVATHGIYDSFIGIQVDITYFAFCLPFLLPYISRARS